MRLANSGKLNHVTKRQRRFGQGAFSLIEILICMGILMIFAGSVIVGMTMTNSMAMSTRNQTLARSIVNQRLNMMMAREWKPTDTIPIFEDSANKLEEPIKVWQYNRSGKPVSVNGTVVTWTEPDIVNNGMRRVNVRLTYNFMGRDIVLESSSLRAMDM